MENSKEKIIQYLVENNTREFNILKTIEECNELALILTQSLTKPHKVTEDHIIEEIGDVKIRLKILSKLYSKYKIKDRVNSKLAAIYKIKNNE